MVGRSILNPGRKRARRAALVCAAACAAVLAAAPVRAEDDEAFDQKILRNILEGIGLRSGNEAGIDYRERSPLVIPPNNTLPAPEKSHAANDPNWPVNPEIKLQKTLKASNKSTKSASQAVDDEARVLRPDEMTPGGSGGRRSASSAPSSDSDRIMSPSELGTKRGLFGGLFAPAEETAPFTGEPPRASLVAPPVGYQTPSAAQPYGLSKSIEKPKAEDSFTTRSEAKY